MIKGLIFDIRRFSVHDGPGIRTTVFFKGCPLSCWWCHNPESRLAEPEISIKSIKLDGKVFRFKETTGFEITIPELIREIEKDRIFFDESGGGVTLSGGEPLFQPEFFTRLVKELKQQGYHIALDTCGYAGNDVFERILPDIDLFLFDIKLINDNEHVKYTGVSNQQILKNLHLLFENQKKIIIRFPVIPGITDTLENIAVIKSVIQHSPFHQFTSSPIEIHLLPYHSLAKEKYKRFGTTNKLPGVPDMKKDDLNELKEGFERMGFKVRIGG